MSAQIIDGKVISAGIKEQVKADVAAFTAKTGVVPGLVVVLCGDDPASQVYVSNKVKTCKELGMNSTLGCEARGKKGKEKSHYKGCTT
jgi:methylenetetrahydrofolate dehydrogenase (NADP+)/methenyltetrahydrofolate cyclohydrolase